MNSSDNSFGKTIREARLAKGMTQAELGSLLGYSSMAISHFEKGTRSIREDELVKMTHILGLNRTHAVASSTTLFRATSTRGGASASERSLQAFDKFITEKYGSNPN